MDLVSFLGPSGTFSQEAAEKISDNLISLCTIPAVMDSVETNKCKYGIVPIENSIEGPVGITLDSLAHNFDLKIFKEIIIPINHCLLINPDAEISDITDIYSHNQAIAQCQGYIFDKNFNQHFTVSTAKACEFIKDNKNFAAIGNSKASEIYGLKIADSKIQDMKNNETRFVVLSKESHKYTGSDKTSIIFSVDDDRPGQLYEILGIFNRFNVNLTKIESRPSKEGLGNYLFFIDFQGHITEAHIIEILNEIEEKSIFLKILGSYLQYK